MAKMKVVQAPNPGGGCKPRNSKDQKAMELFRSTIEPKELKEKKS